MMSWITKTLDIASISLQPVLLLVLILVVAGVVWLTFRFNGQSWQG